MDIRIILSFVIPVIFMIICIKKNVTSFLFLLGATVLLMTAYYRRMRRLRLTEEAQSIGGAPSALDAPPAETQQVER